MPKQYKMSTETRLASVILTQPYIVQKQLKSVAEVHLQCLVKLSANDYVECVVLK